MPSWHGFRAARRGIGSNLNRLGVDDTFIQKILRHSNVSTTQGYYINATDQDKLGAMKRQQRLIVVVPPWSHQQLKKLKSQGT